MASNLLKVVLIEFDSSTLTGSFQDFGDPVTGPVYQLDFYNNSDVDVYLTDGVSNWMVPTLKQWSSLVVAPGKAYLPTGGQLQIKQVTAAGTGDITANLVLER